MKGPAAVMIDSPAKGLIRHPVPAIASRIDPVPMQIRAPARRNIRDPDIAAAKADPVAVVGEAVVEDIESDLCRNPGMRLGRSEHGRGLHRCPEYHDPGCGDASQK